MIPRIGATLEGPRLPAASGKARQLAVFCHGYGANGADLIALGQHWSRLLPDTAFAAPNAPEGVPGYAGGFQWFPITRLDPHLMAQGVRSAASALDGFLDAELARHNLPADRLALIGFSQGTMMALHVGLRRKTAPLAIVGFSGALAGAEALQAEIAVKPPVLLVHGDADDMIPVQALYAAVNALGAAGVTVQFHVSRGVGHGIGPDGLDLAGRFLADAIRAPISPS